MNKNLQQIFNHYTEKFSYINDSEHNENYKWKVAKDFHDLMDKAFSKEDAGFADALYKAKVSTGNMIDNYIQPFQGMVELAKKEPATVKQMFKDLLLTDDHGDLGVQEQLIADFFEKSSGLFQKYTPGSYRFKQDSHAVSAYLFLYAPETHYMFKPAQARIFADCIGFYDDWGTGENIRLSVFYHMCDQAVAAINEDPQLLEVNERRFTGEFQTAKRQMIRDKNRHMLLYDIIYCCSVYDLFDGIRFSKLKSKEKQEFVKNKEKAKEAFEAFQTAQENYDELNEALLYFSKKLTAGSKVTHSRFGKGKIVASDVNYITVDFEKEGEKKLGLSVIIGHKLLKAGYKGFKEDLEKYSEILAKADSIRTAMECTRNEMVRYEDYLD